MPTGPKKPVSLDKSRRNHVAQVGSSSTSTKPTIKDVETKRPQTPNAKSMPAVKGLARTRSESRPAIKESSKSQSGPTPSQATRSHSATATTRSSTPAAAKAPSLTHNRSRLQIPKIYTKEVIPKANKPSSVRSTYDQTPRSGRQDPYHIPSDSEDDDLRGRKLTSVADEGKTTTPSKQKRANSVPLRMRRGTLFSSTLVEATTKSPTPLVPSQKTRVIGEGRHIQSRTPTPIPRGAQIISVDSSSNEPSGHPTPKQKSNVRRSIPPQIARNSTMITVDDSSDEIEPSPTKSLRPRSTTAGGSALSLHTPSRTPKSVEVISLIGSSPQSRGGNSDQVSTPVNPTAKAMGKRSSHSLNSHVKFMDKPEHTTQTLEKTSSIRKGLRANIGSSPNQNPAQIRSKRSGQADRRTVDLENPSSHRAAIDDVKKIMKVRFEKKANDKSIPESFFKEAEYSDAEFQPSVDEKSSSEDQDSDLPSFPGSTTITSPPPVEDSKSPRPYPARTLRSTSNSQPQPSFTPIDRLVPMARERGSSPQLPIRPPKFGRGYSKRVRDAFSDASSSQASEDEMNEQVDSNTTIKSSQDRKADGEESFVAQPSDSAKKPRWSPHSWMERYETEFMPGRDGSVWLANGPFKGWILDGPGAGGYIPGCKEPDDEAVAEAEKTAELRWNLRWADSENDYISDEGDSDYEEVSAGQSTSDIHDSATSTHVEQSPVEDSKKRWHHESSSSNTSQNVTEKASPRRVLDNKVVERAERTERTKQYVLAGGSGNSVDTQPRNDLSKPISSRTRGKFPAYLAPSTVPQDAPSPPSAESETTSTLITQQLINDCAPPSNQELAELMSSNPANRRADTSPSLNKVDELDDSSSSESSSGIPARISPKPPTRPSEVRQTQGASFTPEHVDAAHILGGIAGRRTTRSLTSISPSTVESNKFARSTKRVSARTGPESSSQSKKDSSRTNIVVEVPGLSTEEQDEYEVVSSTPEIRSTLSPKSFKEINEATARVDMESNDPDAEQTLDYVLRQSPRWLTSVTEANEDDIVTNVPKPSFKSLATRSAQESLKDTEKPTSPDLDIKVPDKSSPIVSNMAVPNPVSNLSTASKKEGNGVGRGNAKKRRKRNVSDLGSLVTDESPPRKKQKMDNNQSRAKTARPRYRQRKRRQRRRKQKQQRRNSAQQHVDHVVGNGVSKDIKGNSQSTITPPASSRPTSCEAE